MSPYRFGITSTSNCDGFITRCMHAASTIFSSYWMSGYSRATARAHVRKSPSPSFMMLALWMAVTFLRPCVPRVLERKTGDARRRALRDDLQALDDARYDFVLEARVEILGVLADDDHVHALEPGRHSRNVPDRTKVRVEVERLPQSDIHAGEPFADRRRDRTLERDLVAPDGVEHFARQRAARFLDGSYSGQLRVPVDGGARCSKDPLNGVGDFGPDAVAGNERDGVTTHARTSRAGRVRAPC